MESHLESLQCIIPDQENEYPICSYVIPNQNEVMSNEISQTRDNEFLSEMEICDDGETANNFERLSLVSLKNIII